jgi:cysteine-rich repeat protein
MGDSGQAGASGEGGVTSDGGGTTLCGNGALDSGETCDDGNTKNRDGCSNRCAVEAEFSCSGTPSTCIPLSSCAGMVGDECGGDDCCSSPQVTGGTVWQGEMNELTSIVSTFRLDKFEVTVSRFRRFVSAYDSWRPQHPMVGEGQHPRLSSASGWDASYDDGLPKSASALRSDILCDQTYATWGNDSERDSLPMNCVNWYEAFAFCLWDGGRLPTESEWEYAAAGGNDDRSYPWGNSPMPDDLDSTYAVYDCLGDGVTDCLFSDIQPVGSRAAGIGRYGQLDLAGSMWEWALDWYADYPTTSPVTNYANIEGGAARVARGGDWANRAHYYLRTYYRTGSYPDFRTDIYGFRCARDL